MTSVSNVPQYGKLVRPYTPAPSTPGGARPIAQFEHNICMVAADIRRGLILVSGDAVPNLTIGMAHVLHSKRDLTMFGRRFLNGFQAALGGRGCKAAQITHHDRQGRRWHPTFCLKLSSTRNIMLKFKVQNKTTIQI